MIPFRPPTPPDVRSKPPPGRVLVIAPHPDDETFGAGGTLLHHARQGDPIRALFVCSGIQGDPDEYFPREKLPAMREAEAREAAQILGIGALTFLGYPDNLSDADYGTVFGNLPSDPDDQRRALVAGFSEKLAAMLATEPADIVYYPWRGELNADHWAVGESVEHLRATHPILATKISWMGYDIWTPLPADTVVDISDVMEDKLRAMSAYRTQLVYRNYEPIVRGLDAYRSLFLEAGATFGEAFTGRYGNGTAT